MSVLKRLSNLFRGLVGLFVGGLEKSNPEALLEVERENLREQIAKYNQGLASHAALCERLMAQVTKQEAHERELKAKITAHLRAGNRGPAGEFALRHQSLVRDLAENRKQLEVADETYKNLVKARDVSIVQAKAKITSLRQSISDMKIKQATAELTEMASGMIAEIGGSGDTLSRLEEMVEHERSEAAGRARVARDGLKTADIDLKGVEQGALAEAALADFAAQEGIGLDAAPRAATATAGDASDTTSESGKSMGPEKQTS